MGCTSSAPKPKIASKTDSVTKQPKQRALDYKEQSERYLKELAKQPNTLVPENYRDGYISVSQFYNFFHGGFCGPYIRNPTYMLIVDFRTREEFEESHIVTAIHYQTIDWDRKDIIKHAQRYSMIVFYDHDGTLAANVLSPLKNTSDLLNLGKIDVSCILGGINSVKRKFSHLVTSQKGHDLKIENHNHSHNYERNDSGLNVANSNVISMKESSTSSKASSISRTGSSSSTIPVGGRSRPCSVEINGHSRFETSPDNENFHLVNDKSSRPQVHWYPKFAVIPSTIPWMPTLVHRNGIFLGRAEQAEDSRVYQELGLTHVLSIGRSPELVMNDIEYLGLDGEKNLYFTFLKATEFIQSAVEKHGKILVHGIEGLNRSAAVIIAYLMSSATCILEEAQFYLRVLRPHLQMDDNCYDCLLRWEKALFGTQLTNLEELWFY